MSVTGERVPVAVLGATGLVGQQLVRLLHGHPWFRLAEVSASGARVGQPYGDAVEWVLDDEMPENAAVLRLGSADGPVAAPLVLSALPAGVALAVERRLVEEGRVVCSNASAHRMAEDVPLLVPDVNLGALPPPPARGGGLLVTNPNCVVAGLAPVVAAIHGRWGVVAGTVVTLQALSGAGLGGPLALQALGNVVPWIPGEEEKIGPELSKILGSEIPLAVAVNRVPMRDGHLAHVFLKLATPASPGAVEEALADFGPPDDAAALPSVPQRPLRVSVDPSRPQPRPDIAWAGGMGVTVGRVRSVPGYDVALALVVHNAVRGAAGACLANAEAACAKGWVDASTHPRPSEVVPP